MMTTEEKQHAQEIAAVAARLSELEKKLEGFQDLTRDIRECRAELHAVMDELLDKEDAL